jgi:hypothetical protein
MQGVCCGKAGIFPAAYVQQIDPLQFLTGHPVCTIMWEHSSRAEPVSKLVDVRRRRPEHRQQHRAIFAFHAANADELELQVGDMVMVWNGGHGAAWSL